MNKLEKVALQLAALRGKPVVLVINNVHYFRNNEEGRNMLLQLQQKAEAWAASGKEQHLFFLQEIDFDHVSWLIGILTMVFSS